MFQKTLETQLLLQYNIPMNKNLLPKEPCPFKPGCFMTPECARLLGNACPKYKECIKITKTKAKPEAGQSAES